MRRFYELVPTFILLGIIVFSLYIRYVLHGMWVNTLVLGITELFLYSPFALYIDAFIAKYEGEVNKSLGLKLFQYYLTCLWFGTIIIGIYSMNHN